MSALECIVIIWAFCTGFVGGLPLCTVANVSTVEISKIKSCILNENLVIKQTAMIGESSLVVCLFYQSFVTFTNFECG